MAKVFDIITRVGISYESISDAVKSIVENTNKERQVSWFEVIEQRGRVTHDGKIEYQVTVKIGIKSE